MIDHNGNPLPDCPKPPLKARPLPGPLRGKPRAERRPAEPTDGALICAFLFGAVGLVAGFLIAVVVL